MLEELSKIAVWLFDNNGVHLIHWYLVLIVFDTIIGTVRSAHESRLKSRSYLYGLLIKLLAIMCIPIANMTDDLVNNYMHAHIGFDISDGFTVALLLYEAISIVENLHAMGAFTGNLQKILDNIFANEDKK